MADNEKQDVKKVMDVSNPGTTKPSESSKNIIIKSNPILKDPMINDDTISSSDDLDAEGEVVSGPPDLPKTLSRKINIEPLRDNLKVNQENTEDDLPKQEEVTPKTSALTVVELPESNQTNSQSEPELKLPIQEEQVSGSEQEAKEDPKKPEEQSVTSDNQKSDPETLPPPDQPSDQETFQSSNHSPEQNSKDPSDSLINKKQVNDSSEQKLAQLAEQEAQKRSQEIDRMVESKQYFLPINKLQKRKTKHFVIVGVILSVLLILVWLYIANKTGIIKL